MCARSSLVEANHAACFVSSRRLSQYRRKYNYRFSFIFMKQESLHFSTERHVRGTKSSVKGSTQYWSCACVMWRYLSIHDLQQYCTCVDDVQCCTPPAVNAIACSRYSCGKRCLQNAVGQGGIATETKIYGLV